MTNSRQKGARAEREFADVLRSLGYRSAKRTARSYTSGAECPDVSGLPGCHLEVKRTERLRLHDAMAQAEDDARPDEVPMVAHRQNGQPWCITVHARDLPRFAKAVADVDGGIPGNYCPVCWHRYGRAIPLHPHPRNHGATQP